MSSELKKLLSDLEKLNRSVLTLAQAEAAKTAKAEAPVAKRHATAQGNGVRDIGPKGGRSYTMKQLEGMEHRCPHCGKKANILEHHGARLDQFGRLKFQSWCRACRSSNDAHPTRKGLPLTYNK